MESPVKKSKESKKGRFVPELNNMEHINAQLKGKLKILTVEMKDAVERMNSMAAEMNSIRNENQLYKDRLAELEQENALLISQLEEMANERAERDAIIDEFSTAVETRIVEWKEILDEKDSMIAKLKENLMYAASDRPVSSNSPEERSQTEIERLTRDIDRRDEIIAELQAKLSEAVIEINESSLLIEKFKSDSGRQGTSKRSAKDQREINKKKEDVSKRISTLENLLERAEKDAKVKSEQLCEALAILNKYEDENKSLAEALDEIKELRAQIAKKNKHIEDLVDVINRLEMENSRYEEAIIILRDKIEVAEGEELSLESLILHRHKIHEEKIEEMQRTNDQLSSENVDLKFQIRKLKTALKESLKNKLKKTNGISSDGEHIEELSQRSESQKEHVELRRIKENVKWVIEENEALRQGMHEILDSIHNQDGKSVVTIQSQTLENLLEALDARHLAGWYHPAMRLQGRVNYLQGSNAELRAQLQQIRRNQMLHESEMQQRSSSVEEGECREASSSTSPDGKPATAAAAAASELRLSPSATPKSSRSVHSLNADSGRASGKALESDEPQQPATPEDGLVSGDTPTNEEDEGLGRRSERVYALAKELLARESESRATLLAAERRRKELEARLQDLRRSFEERIAPDVHAELRRAHLEASTRLRTLLEERLAGEMGQEAATTAGAAEDLRRELLGLHARLAELTAVVPVRETGAAEVGELEGRVAELRAENERLARDAELAREEAMAHRAVDSALLAEFGELRRRIADLEAGAEGREEARETARLSLELVDCKVVETELRERARMLERDLLRAREELAELDRRRESDGEIRQDSRGQMDHRHYIEIIEFLQNQYACSTSLSAYERYEASLMKLNNDRNEVRNLITKINEQNESLKIQQETLTGRLQIVEQLKDILEQQIGSSEVQDIMQKFTIQSKQTLAETKYKMQISQLEEESRRAKKTISDYEGKVAQMELEISKAQKAWQMQKTLSFKRPVTADKVTETDAKTEQSMESKEIFTKFTQTELNVQSIETQCALCCKVGVDRLLEDKDEKTETEKDSVDEGESDDMSHESEDESVKKVANIALLQEQLGQALNLASERSIALSKSESQLVELRAKVAALTKLLEERSSLASPKRHAIDVVLEPMKDSEGQPRVAPSREALHSTIKTLERIVAQKEETIARYQSLLKDDRDKHSEAAARLQDEIRSLKRRLAGPPRSHAHAPDNHGVAKSECPERDLSAGESRAVEEETSILREKISRLETELGISSELAERWHRLAEDRLRHMDSTRERLEEQHKEEIESYRAELNKRQSEINELRRELSENRRAPATKTEVLSFMKALQIKDNRLADEIENELEEQAAAVSQQLSTTYTVEDSRLREIEQSQSKLDNLRKQLQASMERERSYKSEIAELQQQLSRRHMAVKAQEKKASRREMQLERKVKELEEELHEAKEMLDRHFMVQQAKRAKTAEDLGLWEKLKKWQQTAERLKERLKDKTDECQRLQTNYEKLRNLIACMEREKLFLRERKLRSESIPTTPSTAEIASTPIVINSNEALVEELRAECRELRCRVKELLGRLSRRDAEVLEEKRRIASAAFEDDEYVNAELRRLREIQEILEKENLRLETENFELRLELERANVNLPRYEEKVQHLEKYIELLKSEKCAELSSRRGEGGQRTKSELERTVVALKSLVEKLQQENKRLRGGGGSPSGSECNCPYLGEQLEQARHRVACLETELELAQRRMGLVAEGAPSAEVDGSEVALLRDQLRSKSELLLRVKDLLAKATANEKALRQRIQQLEFKQTLSAIPECEASLAIT